MTKGLVLTARGETRWIDTNLADLQKAVGGWVEAVDLPHYTMWLNEEGKMLDLEPNIIATGAYVQATKVQDLIMGDVVFTGIADEDGEILPLDPEIAKSLELLASNLN